MKSCLTALAAALTALVIASPALAKGASEAKITGPGLKGGGIHLKSDGGGDPTSGSPLGDLAEFSGIYPEVFGQEPNPLLPEQPKGTLGPKYTAEYTIPGPNGENWTIRQDLYPYAKPDPVTYMKPGQPVFDSSTRGGWYQAPHDLKTTLVDEGLPASAPRGGSGSDWTLSRGATTIIAAALLLLLLALTFLVVRRRPRPIGA
jgi:hypothetical protein